MHTAARKNFRSDLVPVMSAKVRNRPPPMGVRMFETEENACVNKTNQTIGWTREKKRNGGRRRVFLIHRPAMLPTSPRNSPADITSTSDGERPKGCVGAV